MQLEGKVAIITGASRGIGRALALGFAREGAAIVAAARTEQPAQTPGSLEETVQEVRGNGGQAIGVRCDVTRPDDARGVVERTLQEFGRVDILVNNAGVYVEDPLLEMEPGVWEQVLRVNVLGPMLMCKSVLPSMMARQRGNILNISSRNGDLPYDNDLVYGPSKAALTRFSQNLAKQVRQYNIAVNAYCPGLILTEMAKGVKDALAREPDPPEITLPSCVWLVQQDARSFTGHMVYREHFRLTWP
ncbi:MAG: SDR family oxidoreductase [Chloroflexi bacterium]|nr:SDR family oxidoreductase [Chloroflexota bacterium]